MKRKRPATGKRGATVSLVNDPYGTASLKTDRAAQYATQMVRMVQEVSAATGVESVWEDTQETATSIPPFSSSRPVRTG